MRIRLDKYIASVTDYSRTEAKRLLKNREILCNDTVVTNPAEHIDTNHDIIALYGESLASPSPRYFMLNKPQKTVCATEDSEHPTVIDLLDEPNRDKLQIAGRLDKDTTGLILITDNGQWNHRITSPKKACFKTYYVTTVDPISDEAIQQLETGVLLHQETRPTLPAKVTKINTHQIELCIQEGKYHQVKRMLAAVGNHVDTLHRQKIGNINLDTHLSPGEYRPLSAQEVESI
jgi:16S rRNA pseudouridine516 synthase